MGDGAANGAEVQAQLVFFAGQGLEFKEGLSFCGPYQTDTTSGIDRSGTNAHPKPWLPFFNAVFHQPMTLLQIFGEIGDRCIGFVNLAIHEQLLVSPPACFICRYENDTGGFPVNSVDR